VTPGDLVSVNVGGTNGFNGGGSAWANGGGASDIRIGGNRVVVAAGGGSAGTGSNGGSGGSGGWPVGTAGQSATDGYGDVDGGGGGGTQSAGGTGGTATPGASSTCPNGLTAGQDGSLGSGGAGARTGLGGIYGGGGGGGGYYGGGGGATNQCDGRSGGGGGGSSYGPLGTVFGVGVVSGDGHVNLTAIPQASAPPPPPPLIPSSNCDAGTQVTNSTVEGVHVKLYTRQPSSTEVDVCFRAEDLTLGGVGVGGEAVITDALPQISGVGVPSIGLPTVDNNSSACKDNQATNQVPGTHPVADLSVAGVHVLLDTYLNSSAAWVCVQVGTLVNDRVVVPIAVPNLPVPSVTGGPTVHFYPDPGTPVGF
jgi:hypothetical protein